MANIFIVINRSQLDNDLIIESVWVTKKLAKAAIHYHSQDANLPTDSFHIIEREVNRLKK